MKNYFVLLPVFLLFCSCATGKTTNTQNNNIPLMPYYKDGYFGYVNAETFEIVIPAQFEKAGHFTGNFAIVQKGKKRNIQ